MSKPTKTAIVCTELGVGGAERCVARLACGLDPSQYEVRVFLLAPPPPAGGASLVQQIQAAGIHVEFLNLRSSWQFLKCRRRLRLALLNFQPEVLQSFLFHANVMSAQAAPSATSVAFGIRVADPRTWRHWLERRSAKRADRIVCVSESVRRFCETTAGFPAEKLCVIPNGIEFNARPAAALTDGDEAPSPSTLRDGRRMILCVGRLHHQKGYDWLLRQWKRWSGSFPEHDLVIAGDGPARDSLRAQTQELKISDRVVFLGQRKDIPKLLDECELFLLPSRWEGMPNALLEAMAAGRPVVASHAEGVLEVLGEELARDEAAPFGDSSEWAAKVAHILEDRVAATRLGRLNRARAESKFPASDMVDKYATMFEDLVGQRRVAR